MRVLRTVLLVGVVACVLAPSTSASARTIFAPPTPTAVGGFATPTGDGFWLVYPDGRVAVNGDAPSYGGPSGLHLSQPIESGTGTPQRRGYWLVARDGGIFSYGNARFYGSMGATHLNQPVFAMASTRSGRGYWLVARDGGIFSFGDARFHGSTGAIALNQPIVGLTTSASGNGYRMVARDGGIFSFGDAKYYGSLPGLGLHVSDVVGMALTPSRRGYWIARASGPVYAFGDARNFGHHSISGWDTQMPGWATLAIFSNPVSQGYRLLTYESIPVNFGDAPGGQGLVVFCPPLPPSAPLPTKNGTPGCVDVRPPIVVLP
jgi:hypothetical protein